MFKPVGSNKMPERNSEGAITGVPQQTITPGNTPNSNREGFQTGASGNKVPVAIYKNPYDKVLRSVLHFVLVYIAPIFFIIVVYLVISLTIQANNDKVQPGTTSETIALGDIPLPPGVRLITLQPDPIYSDSAAISFGAAIPNYEALSKKTEVYATKETPDDLNSYYTGKLVKTGMWQQYNKNRIKIPYSSDVNTESSTEGFVSYDIYVRSTTTPKVIEGLRIQYETLSSEILSRRASLVGHRAEAGDTLVYFSKLTLHQLY